MSKKCIVIGSGYGGLTTAMILAKNGYQVTVLEQQAVAGGCLQCFRRHGAVFETGMHFIGSADRGQTMRLLLHFLGIDDLPLSRLDTDAYNIISLNHRQFRIPNGKQQLIERMNEYFPGQADNMRRFFSAIENVVGASAIHDMTDANSGRQMDVRYQLTAIDEIFDELFDSEELKNVLVGDLSLYAAERGKTPFYTYAFITDFYNKSAWRIAGGSDSIAQRLIAGIERQGGQVICRKEVKKILIDDNSGMATGVDTADGDHYDADLVISAIHPKRLLTLTDTPLLRPAYRKRVMAVPETSGCFTVYLRFKPNTVPYMNSNFYGYRNSSPWGCENYSLRDGAKDNWPMGYLYMHLCNEDGQQWAQSGVLLSYMRFSEVEQWTDTTVGHRGDDYEAFKRQKAEQLIDLLATDFPDIREGIAEYFTSTPLTYRDYTGTYHGAMYGIAKDVTMGPACRVHHRTKIPNLLLTGQNVNSHGILGVTVGSLVTCGELIGSDNLYKQIQKENEEL